MSETIAAADARANFSELLAKAYYQGQLFVVKKSRKPVAVIIGVNEFKALQQRARGSSNSVAGITAKKGKVATAGVKAPNKAVNKVISVSY